MTIHVTVPHLFVPAVVGTDECQQCARVWDHPNHAVHLLDQRMIDDEGVIGGYRTPATIDPDPIGVDDDDWTGRGD
jgi:hypothetical protein